MPSENTLSGLGLFTLLLISSLTIMVGTAIAPSLGEIARQLHFPGSPEWLITLPSLGVVIFAPIVGRMIDRHSPYSILLGGLIPYALFGAAGAFLENPYLLIADRVLLGGAAAALQAAGTAIIAESYAGDQRLKVVAWQGMAIELGGVVFLSTGGILGEWHWQLPFSIYLLALICLFLMLISIPKRSDGPITETEKVSFSRQMPGLAILSMLAMILFFVCFTLLPLYLPAVFSFSASRTGYLMAGISLIAVISASQMPKISLRMGNMPTVSVGFVLFALGLLVFSFAQTLAILVSGALAMGIGFGFTVPLLNHLTVEISSQSTRGRNLGLYSMGIFGGQFLSSFVTSLSADIPFIFQLASGIGILAAISTMIIDRQLFKR